MYTHTKKHKHTRGPTGNLGLHTPVQGCHGDDLPLVYAELGDSRVRFDILGCPLRDGSPRVKVEHLGGGGGGRECWRQGIHTHTRVWNTANARETATAMFLRVLTHRTQCQDTDLMKDEGTLQATLAGSICLEVALGVFQTGKHWATGAVEGMGKWEWSAITMLILCPQKQTTAWPRLTIIIL